MRSRPQHDILAVQPNQLGNPQTGLDRNQDEGLIATTDPGGTIRDCQQCLHLVPIEKFDRFSYVAFIRHRQYPLAMEGMRGLF